MPFNFDVSSPADTASIPGFPANERNHRAAVKNSLEVEHDTAEGRHKFGYGDATARNAITTWVNGSVWFLELSPYYNALIRAGGVWVEVVPPARYANRNEIGAWGLPQRAATATVTPGAGSPNTIAVSAAVSPHRKVTLTADSILSNPSAFDVNSSTVVTMEVHQDGTGGRTLSFDTQYAFPAGAPPVISSAANSVSLLTLVRLDSGYWLVSCAPDVRPA